MKIKLFAWCDLLKTMLHITRKMALTLDDDNETRKTPRVNFKNNPSSGLRTKFPDTIRYYMQSCEHAVK
jgi:hypothetical protein